MQPCDFIINFPGIGNGHNCFGYFPDLSVTGFTASLQKIVTNGGEKEMSAWYQHRS